MFEKVLTRRFGTPGSETIDSYMASGGYEALPKVLKEYTPERVTELVSASGLRGRGGAGFPAGRKWSFMPREPDLVKYVCVNADEGEPGTFKDRALMEQDPHQVIEGTIIASYAVSAQQAFVYIRGELSRAASRIATAIDQAYAKGFLGKDILGSGFSLDMSLFRGAGAYVCGEETALIESLEGQRGEPRKKPPYPASVGVWGKPTLVNNVETLANVPHIINRGVEWYTSIGTARSMGPKIFCISGHVNRPGLFELPLGIPLRTLIEDHAGGMAMGKKLKAVIPGGSSTPMLTAEHLDTPMAFESLQEAGSALGTGAVIVMNEDTCMVDVARRLTRFYVHESCGRCTPCRVGTMRLLELLQRIVDGRGQPEDVARLEEIGRGIQGLTFCPLGDAAVNPVLSSVKFFKDEYEHHIEHKGCAVAS
jgi:NADH-quinone oxidoreductase subunit F